MRNRALGGYDGAGLWSGQFNGGISAGFIERTAELNPYAPAAVIPAIAWTATALETTLGVTLIAGVAVRWTALASAILLAWFAIAMAVFTGPKPPLDYSVFSASACALLLALHKQRTKAALASPGHITNDSFQEASTS